MSFLRALLSPIQIAFFTILGAVLAVPSRLFDSTGDTVIAIARMWSKAILRCGGVRLRTEFRAPLDPKVPYVFLANHASSVDIWAVLAVIPRTVRLIAKKQLGRIPIFGWAMLAGRFIFIDRQNAHAARRSIQLAGQRIHDGESVLLFPEGTRSRDGSLGPFKKGGFHLAMQAGVPIVPVALRGTMALMPRGSLFLRSGTVEVIVGAPIPTEGLTDADRPALIEKVRGEVAAMLDSNAVSK